MKLTNLSAIRMLSSLRAIDSDQNVKLPGQIRLDIARNINRLIPEVSAYEKARNGLQRELKAGNDAIAVEANKTVLSDMEALGETEMDISLINLDHGQFNLDDNKRITGDMIAALAPILKDFDTP